MQKNLHKYKIIAKTNWRDWRSLPASSICPKEPTKRLGEEGDRRGGSGGGGRAFSWKRRKKEVEVDEGAAGKLLMRPATPATLAFLGRAATSSRLALHTRPATSSRLAFHNRAATPRNVAFPKGSKREILSNRVCYVMNLRLKDQNSEKSQSGRIRPNDGSG